jgi:hypothetical protein
MQKQEGEADYLHLHGKNQQEKLGNACCETEKQTS